MPPAAQIRDALERILSSDIFARSERARDLLRYLVDQDLAGHADRLKGFSIAIDVFGKDDRFDPSTDTVVRVQAGRLRDLLDQYYAKEGAAEPLRISIPRGSYVPSYASADGPLAAPVPAAAAETPPLPAVPPRDEAGRTPDRPSGRAGPIPRYGIAVAGILMLLLVVAAATYAWLAPHRAGVDAIAGAAPVPVSVSEVTGAAPREMLPSVYLDVSAAGDDADRVAALLRRGLSSFDTINFIARAPQGEAQGVHRRTDFVFLIEDEDRDSLHVELQNVLSGKVLLSRSLPLAGKSRSELEDDVAALLTTVAPVSGVIYASLAEEGAETPLTRCLLLNERYYRDQNAQAHRAAYDCLLGLAGGDAVSSLVFSELASLHVQAMAGRFRYPPEQSEAQALEFARKAVQLAPGSPYAHRSMGYVLSRTAHPEEALRWSRKAYELNTFDLGMAASYGYGLIFAGLYAEGTPILQRAANASSAHPTWWDYGLALGHLMLGDMRAGANAATALASSERPHYIAVRLAIAHELRNLEEVDTLRVRLQRDQPGFAADPQAVFRRGSYPEDMTKRLMQSLREAGLVDAS